MQEKKTELDLLNVKVAVVTFEDSESAERYHPETSASYPILIDELRSLYKSYGMERAGFWDIWGPATWIAYFKELLKGRLPGKPGSDIYQRGGDVLIDPNGIVRIHHIGSGPADRPSIDSILKAITINN